MGPVRARFSTRQMMIAIAVFAVLIVVAIRLVHAGLFLGISLYWEREELRLMREALVSAKTEGPPFVEYDKEVANYHAVMSAYHSRCKWVYLRAMFELWAGFPQPPPVPELPYPDIPYVPSPRPIPRADGDRCTCSWYAKHRTDRGPCKHVLNVQIVLDDEAAR